MKKRSKRGKNIDPICGMKGHIKAYGHYFCSQDHVKEYEKKHNIKPPLVRRPWFFYSLITLIIIVFIIFLQLSGSMLMFMGAFFIVFSYLKFIDWKGFAQAFARYDLIAEKSKLYAYLYPLIELWWGISYLVSSQITLVASTTLVIMVIGTVGVTKNILKKNPVKCACLGTQTDIPLTNFTLIEDVTMAVMALIILL